VPIDVKKDGNRKEYKERGRERRALLFKVDSYRMEYNLLNVIRETASAISLLLLLDLCSCDASYAFDIPVEETARKKRSS